MTAFETFFNPTGRLSPGAFWRAWTVLVAASLAAASLEYLVASARIDSGEPASGPSFLGGNALFYWPVAAVLAKRFHDSGRTGWWVVPVGIGFGMASGMVTLAVLGAADSAVLADMAEAGLNERARLMAELSYRNWLALAAPITALQLAVGYGMWRLPSDPEPNAHGPPPPPARFEDRDHA